MKRMAYDCSWSPPPSGLSNQEKDTIARLKNYLEERKTSMKPGKKIRRMANRNAIAEADALELLRRDADVEFKIDKEGDLCAKIKSLARRIDFAPSMRRCVRVGLRQSTA